MKNTVIHTFPFVVASPNGLKVNLNPLDHPEIFLIHDWANDATYPAQTTPVPLDTLFVNIAPGTLVPSHRYQAKKTTLAYNATDDCITFPSGASNKGYLIGATNSPFSGQATDVLIKLNIRFKESTGFKRVYKSPSDFPGAALVTTNTAIGYGFTANKVIIWALGAQLSVQPDFPLNEFHDLALYIRPQGINGAGVIQVYIDKILSHSQATSVTAFRAETELPQFGDEFGGQFMDIKSIFMMQGIYASGLPLDYYL